MRVAAPVSDSSIAKVSEAQCKLQSMFCRASFMFATSCVRQQRLTELGGCVDRSPCVADANTDAICGPLFFGVVLSQRCTGDYQIRAVKTVTGRLCAAEIKSSTSDASDLEWREQAIAAVGPEASTAATPTAHEDEGSSHVTLVHSNAA